MAYPDELSSPLPDLTLSAGYTPDYEGLIKSDPSYVSAQNAAQSAQANADAARRQNVRSEYVRYGGTLPSGWSDAYGDIDQPTKDAASGNQFSTIAGLHDNYSRSVEQFRKALSARGMLQSSELAYGQDQLDRGLGQSEYDAANAFTGNTAQAYGAYTNVLGQNARDIASGVSAAQQSVYSNPAYRPVAAKKAHYDASSSSRYGQVLYSDENGVLYGADGSVFQIPYSDSYASLGYTGAAKDAAIDESSGVDLPANPISRVGGVNIPTPWLAPMTDEQIGQYVAPAGQRAEMASRVAPTPASAPTVGGYTPADYIAMGKASRAKMLRLG